MSVIVPTAMKTMETHLTMETHSSMETHLEPPSQAYRSGQQSEKIKLSFPAFQRIMNYMFASPTFANQVLQRIVHLHRNAVFLYGIA